VRRLTIEGPTALDPARPADRTRAVAATVEASLTLLKPGDRDRYLDLAIFPEDIDIPLDVLELLLWPDTGVQKLCDKLTGLGLGSREYLARLSTRSSDHVRAAALPGRCFTRPVCRRRVQHPDGAFRGPGNSANVPHLALP
jgi:hypothetical protein